MLERILEWDRDTFIYLNSLGIERFDRFWSFVTDLGSWIPLFIVFIYLLFRHLTFREVLSRILVIAGLILFIEVSTDLSKEFFARLRPNNNTEINTLIRILRRPSSYSFISGHAATSFSITTIVVLFLREEFKWVWFFFLWPALFGFSRIYVGVHYPSDIIAGAAFGTLSAMLFYWLYLRFIEPGLRLTHRGPGA